MLDIRCHAIQSHFNLNRDVCQMSGGYLGSAALKSVDGNTPP